MQAISVFSCIGHDAEGLQRAGIEVVQLCEKNSWRRSILSERFNGIEICEDIYTMRPKRAQIVVGGPPCQKTSRAAAAQGKRTGETLFRPMLEVGLAAGAEWIVVEQPNGNAAWEAIVARRLSRAGYHVSRLEFSAADVGAPYLRKRVYFLACTSLPRLQIAWSYIPTAIAIVKVAALSRGTWNVGKLGVLQVDAWLAGERGKGNNPSLRRKWIEALGDSNPSEMIEAIALAINQTKEN